ncbi:MAG: ABC-type transport auxiliary lipoprotein family protein [Pseudomonadota bacterium]
MTRLNMIAVCLSAVLLSGCVGKVFETTPPKPRYLFSAAAMETLEGDPVGWSLVVETPKAARAYDTTKIAVSRTSGRIEYFANGEWAGRAPRVVQTALVESFEDSGRILSVGDANALPLSDLKLQTDLRRIDLDVSNGGAVARLDIYARLTNGRGKIFAARRFQATAPADASSGDDVAAAFETSFETIVVDLVPWALAKGEAAMAPTEAGA